MISKINYADPFKCNYFLQKVAKFIAPIFMSQPPCCHQMIPLIKEGTLLPGHSLSKCLKRQRHQALKIFRISVCPNIAKSFTYLCQIAILRNVAQNIIPLKRESRLWWHQGNNTWVLFLSKGEKKVTFPINALKILLAL